MDRRAAVSVALWLGRVGSPIELVSSSLLIFIDCLSTHKRWVGWGACFLACCGLFDAACGSLRMFHVGIVDFTLDKS